MTLLAATQRPTQKAMGSGAVRSQMDVRICLRVRERRDVDLILGQGMLAAGWAADTLNAPGKFLISTPEHTTPRRARAYCVDDRDVAAIAARHTADRPQLDALSRDALAALAAADEGESPPADLDDPAATLWAALLDAPETGRSVRELHDRHQQGPRLGLRTAAGTRGRRPRHADQPRTLDRHRGAPVRADVRADVRDARTPIRAGARDGRTSARTIDPAEAQGRRRRSGRRATAATPSVLERPCEPAVAGDARRTRHRRIRRRRS